MDRIIGGLVDEFQKEYALAELSQSEAFEAFTAYCVLSTFYEEEFNPDAFRTGGGNDLGIDAVGIVLNGVLLQDAEEVRAHIAATRRLDARVVVIQAKTSQGFETKVVSDLADNLGHIVTADALPYPASTDIENLRSGLEAIYSNIPKLAGALPELHVFYVTTGEQVADMVAQKAQSAREHLAKLGRFDRVEFQCVTKDDLRRLYRRATTKVAVQFPMPRKVVMPKVPDVEQALMGLLSARDLVNNILSDDSGRLRKTLFHSNVRDFLSEENPVNKEIGDTLRDEQRRDRFAVLNNGVTIVTRGLSVVGDDVYLDDFQIVNGCQTCHVLFGQRALLTDNVHVSLRIVHSQDEDVINGIVGATNRQTVISEEDLTVREKFHRLLEDFFVYGTDKQRALYYERRTKQYADRKGIVKSRVITRAQLTRSYLAMFLNEPARLGHYRSLLSVRGKDLFGDNHQPVVYYTAASGFYRLDWLLRNGRIPRSFSPFRFHLLAAVKLRLLGPDPVPHVAKAANRACARILDVMWDANAAERLVGELLVPLQRAIDAERGLGVAPSEMVRTKRFSKLVQQEVAGSSTA
ncbi:AIPR family protein [Saccharothrix obliqua]|uniref:AIPR family protein n=1 Tax=Saccharothrix obliqua TaxID=2861747 RepID=UPI001C5F6F23|nr:AIPR family protein [Saccharothrix obliqua]MBW4720347.1 AIPR family protein [Saccharothrix obliqua]